MRILFLVRSAFFALAACLVSAAAQPAASGAFSRVAVVDVGRVLSSSKAGKAANERLSRLRDERVTKARAMEEEVTALEKEITTKRATLNETQLNRLQEQMADKRRTMTRYVQDAETALKAAQDRELQALEASIKPHIDAVAKEGGWTAIFNKFESGLIWVAEANDISDLVIKRVDETLPAK